MREKVCVKPSPLVVKMAGQLTPEILDVPKVDSIPSVRPGNSESFAEVNSDIGGLKNAVGGDSPASGQGKVNPSGKVPPNEFPCKAF